MYVYRAESTPVLTFKAATHRCAMHARHCSIRKLQINYLKMLVYLDETVKCTVLLLQLHMANQSLLVLHQHKGNIVRSLDVFLHLNLCKDCVLPHVCINHSSLFVRRKLIYYMPKMRCM